MHHNTIDLPLYCRNRRPLTCLQGAGLGCSQSAGGFSNERIGAIFKKGGLLWLEYTALLGC